MGPSLQIARVLGIPVKLHWTMLLLLPLPYFLIGSEGLDWGGVGFFAIVFLLVAVCVILHELGHALAARYYGIGTDDIILSPLFGVARLKKLPESPSGEFVVALAGPLVNVALGLLSYALLHLLYPGFLWEFSSELWDNLRFGTERVRTIAPEFSRLGMMLGVAVLVNAGLVGFNLIPAFPMDGGRMFRAVLHRFTDKLTATRIATWLGQGLSVLLIMFSLGYGQYGMVLVGMFIYYMAGHEYQSVKYHLFRGRFSVLDMLREYYTTLDTFATKGQVRKLFLNGYEKNFLVTEPDGKLKGLLLKDDIIHWLSDSQVSLENDLGQYLTRDFPVLDTRMSIHEVMETMQERQLFFLPVEEEGRGIIGVLDARGIYEFLEMQQKLQGY